MLLPNYKGIMHILLNLGEWSPFAGAQMDHQAYFLFEDMQPRSTLLRFD
jgi:hypothetical protein